MRTRLDPPSRSAARTIAVVGLVGFMALTAVLWPRLTHSPSARPAAAPAAQPVSHDRAHRPPCPVGWAVCPVLPRTKPDRAKHCTDDPSACGFADAKTTGVVRGAKLVRVPSQATHGRGWHCDPNVPGTYVNGPPPASIAACPVLVVTGDVGSPTRGLELAVGISVQVSASHVTLWNLKLRGAYDPRNVGNDNANVIGINVTDASHVSIKRCDVRAGGPPAASVEADTTRLASPTRGYAGIRFVRSSSFRVSGCHISGFAEGVYPDRISGRSSIVRSYIHRIMCWNYGSNKSCHRDPNGSDHCNAFIDTQGPPDARSSLLLRDNTMYGDNRWCLSTTVSTFADFGDQRDQHLVLYHNLLSARSYYCVNPGGGGAYSNQGYSYVAAMFNSYVATRDDTGQRWGGCGQGGNFYGGGLRGEETFHCGNVFDNGPFAGHGADQSNTYPRHRTKVTSCTKHLAG